MKACRGTIRISLNDDKSSKLRNKLKKSVFDQLGFHISPGGKRTGMWSKYPCSQEEMANCMISMWETIKNFRGRAAIDNYWCSFEEVDTSLEKLRASVPADQFNAELAALGFVPAEPH